MKLAAQPLIDRERIARRVAELGVQLSREYSGKDLVLVGILKGSFIFLADLARLSDGLDLPVEAVVDDVRRSGSHEPVRQSVRAMGRTSRRDRRGVHRPLAPGRAPVGRRVCRATSRAGWFIPSSRRRM